MSVMLVEALSGDVLTYHQRPPAHKRLGSVYRRINLNPDSKWQGASDCFCSKTSKLITLTEFVLNHSLPNWVKKHLNPRVS